MKLNPITENPKVRDLNYHVELESGGSTEDLIAWTQTIRPFGSTESWLKYQLYEFNELHSKELGKFYNPLDFEVQQREFSRLLWEFLEPRLRGTGMRYIKAAFSMP